MDQQQAGAETHRNRAGLLLALGGFITLSAGDGIVKSTAGEWPGPAVAALRYVFGAAALGVLLAIRHRSEEHTSELQSLMRISYAVLCLKKKIQHMSSKI